MPKYILSYKFKQMIEEACDVIIFCNLDPQRKFWE
jgi:hypothetical protein